MSIDWSSDIETVVEAALGEVPEAGGLLGGLCSIMWPSSGDDVWSEVQQQVEQLIGAALAQNVKQQVAQDLEGLEQNLANYLDAVKFGTPELIQSYWTDIDTSMTDMEPHFRWEGYEVLLLPMFASFLTLKLAHLRDGVLFGSGWGWPDDFIATVQSRLTSADPAAYPKPVAVYLDREIYTQPQGSCDDSGAIVIAPAPTQPMTQLTVTHGDYVQTVQVGYPEGGGPDGVTTTSAMGYTDSSAQVTVIDVTADNPITIAGGAAGDIVNSLWFGFQDGTSVTQLGGVGGGFGGTTFRCSYPGEILSSVHINGASAFYECADCVVFGFKFQQAATVDPNGVRLLYIGSPAATPIESLTSRADERLAGELSETAIREDWEGQRVAFWDAIRARASTAVPAANQTLDAAVGASAT